MDCAGDGTTEILAGLFLDCADCGLDPLMAGFGTAFALLLIWQRSQRSFSLAKATALLPIASLLL